MGGRIQKLKRTVALKDARVTRAWETMRPHHIRGTGACVCARNREDPGWLWLAGAEGRSDRKYMTVVESTYSNTEMTENLREILTKFADSAISGFCRYMFWLLFQLKCEDYSVADPGGGGGAGGARPPFQKNNKKWGPIFVQFCS